MHHILPHSPHRIMHPLPPPSPQGLDRVMHHVLDEPSELIWLDASCNQLITIDTVIQDFPKLQVRCKHVWGVHQRQHLIPSVSQLPCMIQYEGFPQ